MMSTHHIAYRLRVAYWQLLDYTVQSHFMQGCVPEDIT
jgi:hypothetical protein